MNEAKNYIKHLQKRIKELSAKRDELRKLKEFPSNPEETLHECEKYTCSGYFSVHEIKNNNNGCFVGIEVSSSLGEESLFPLSKFLKLMLEEGLEVVNCVTSQVNGRLIHSVQCEVQFFLFILFYFLFHHVFMLLFNSNYLFCFINYCTC